MSEMTYRKLYEHEFDSIGRWWVFRWSRPTGVIYPWGVLHPEEMVPAEGTEQ